MRAKPQNFLTLNEAGCLRSLNMQTPTSLNTLSFHSEKLEKLVEDLESKFAWYPVHPKEDLASIMYRSGQQEVIQYIKSILEE
jgi:uncharacterized protein YecE (DUF72 family)